MCAFRTVCVSRCYLDQIKYAKIDMYIYAYMYACYSGTLIKYVYTKIDIHEYIYAQIHICVRVILICVYACHSATLIKYVYMQIDIHKYIYVQIHIDT